MYTQHAHKKYPKIRKSRIETTRRIRREHAIDKTTGGEMKKISRALTDGHAYVPVYICLIESLTASANKIYLRG